MIVPVALDLVHQAAQGNVTPVLLLLAYALAGAAFYGLRRARLPLALDQPNVSPQLRIVA